MMEGDLTKSAAKNNRWQLLEQRMMFVEKSMDERLCRVEASMKDLKENEIAHLADDICQLRKDTLERHERMTAQISDIKIIIAKAVGALGAILTILNIVLKVWK